MIPTQRIIKNTIPKPEKSFVLIERLLNCLKPIFSAPFSYEEIGQMLIRRYKELVPKIESQALAALLQNQILSEKRTNFKVFF